MSFDEREKSAVEIRDELISQMAVILYALAPDNGKQIINRLMMQLNDAIDREFNNLNLKGREE